MIGEQIMPRATSRAALALACVLTLPAPCALAQQRGGFIERTAEGVVVSPRAAPSGKTRRVTRKSAPRRPRPPAEADPVPDDFYRIDEEAEADRPTADPVVITGKQGAGQVKPIVYVTMGDTSILQCVLAPGRLTQLNLFGEVAHIAFSDYERFRVGYKEGIFFVSPGTKEAALIDWKKVRADLAVIMDDGRQYHFEFSVVAPDRPSHRVINVNAPRPLREPNADERAELERARLEQEEADKAEAARIEAEAARARDEALTRARSAPLVGKARKGPFEVAASDPVRIGASLYVRVEIRNRGREPRPVTVSVGPGNAAIYAAEILLAVPVIERNQTATGIAIVDESAVADGQPFVVSVSSPGEKTVEVRLGAIR